MNYRTHCPQCASVFLIGTDQLDAAQGWVQCSVCGAAFNAHPSLQMEDGSPLPLPEPEVIETPEVAALDAVPVADQADAPPAFSAEPGMAPQALDGPMAEPAGQAERSEQPEAEAPELPIGIAQREAPADLPSIILIDPAADAPDDLGPMPVYDTSAYPNLPAEPAAPPAPAARPFTPSARIEYAEPMPGSARIRQSRRPISPWVWAIASTLLLLALLLQLAYHLRDTLVSQFPAARPGVEQVCDVLGCTLSLPKNLDQLQIIGSDLETEASGRLKLTLTLGNRATHAQAWPVLVLTLTDQRNRPLARRSFAPSEYLENPQRIAAGMPPRSEQPLSLPLTVNDLAPMGFDLRLTY